MMCLTHRSRCRNCGLMHPQSASSPPDCVFITIKRSGRQRLELRGTPDASLRCRLVPDDRSEREKLRNLIWTEFEQLKAENELDRHNVAAAKSGVKIKGELKLRAPIPWLCWASLDGQDGQTRNKTNFNNVWDVHVERQFQARQRHDQSSFYLSSPLLPAKSCGGGFKDLSNYESLEDYYFDGFEAGAEPVPVTEIRLPSPNPTFSQISSMELL